MKKHYYITAINGSRVHFVAGPFTSKKAAEQVADDVKDFAYKADPFSWFFAWGVSATDVLRKTPLGTVEPGNIVAA